MVRPRAVLLACLALACAAAPDNLTLGDTSDDGNHSGACPRHAQEVLDAVLAGYQRRVSPVMHALAMNVTEAPVTVVHAQHVIASVQNVDMRGQAVVLQLWVGYQWTDDRLVWDPSCYAAGDSAWFHGEPSGIVWTPSVYVENLIEEQKVLVGDWGIWSDGTVQISKKVAWKLACTMDFSMMPYDSSLCHAKVTTWTEQSPYIQLAGMDGSAAGAGYAGVSKGEGGALEFSLLTDGVGSAEVGVDDWDFPYMKLFFRLEREPKYRETTVIRPVGCFVFVVYLSFWLTPAAVPARVALVMIGLLAITNKISSVQGSLPELIGSVWLIDFMSVSFFFCFSAIVEFALVNYLTRMEQRVTAAAGKAAQGRETAEAGGGGGGEKSLFLPTTLDGKRVLIHDGGRQYRADNNELQSDDDGLAYCSSANLRDRTNQLCNWGDTVEGTEDDNGWVRTSSADGPARTSSTKQTMRKHTHFYDWVMVASDGKVRIRDQDLDVFMRILFPVAYAIALGVLYARLD